MRALAPVLLASFAAVALAQAPPPVPADPGKLFALPPALSGRAPQSKLQTPGTNPLFGLAPLIVNVHPPARLDMHIDSGIILHPAEGTFAQRPGQLAGEQKLYPGLKILPTEMANLSQPGLPWPQAKVIPIPTTWPLAKVEPIPRTWEGCKTIPVRLVTPAGSR